VDGDGGAPLFCLQRLKSSSYLTFGIDGAAGYVSLHALFYGELSRDLPRSRLRKCAILALLERPERGSAAWPPGPNAPANHAAARGVKTQDQTSGFRAVRSS